MDHKRRLPPQAKSSKQSVSHWAGPGVRGGEGVDFAADKRGVGEGKGGGEKAGKAEEGVRCGGEVINSFYIEKSSYSY